MHKPPFVWNSYLIKTNRQTDLCLTYLSNRAEVFTLAEAPSKPLWMRGRVVRAAWLWETASPVFWENSLTLTEIKSDTQAFGEQGYNLTLHLDWLGPGRARYWQTEKIRHAWKLVFLEKSLWKCNIVGGRACRVSWHGGPQLKDDKISVSKEEPEGPLCVI